MGVLRNEWLTLIARVVVGGFFVYASLDKIAHPEAFAAIVHNYSILPGGLINILAIVLPWLELLTGMALILGTWVDSASLIVSGMLVVFIVAVSLAVARGIKIDCGCFSTSPGGARKLGFPVIIEDFILLLLVLHVKVRGPGRWALEHVKSH